MKKTMILLVCGLVLSAMVSGCSSIKATNRFNGQEITTEKAYPVAHMNAKVWGVYLFYYLPVWTGSLKNPETSAFFQDTVTLGNTMDLLTERSKGYGATKVVDLKSNMSADWVFWSLIFWTKEIEISGNAVR